MQIKITEIDLRQTGALQQAKVTLAQTLTHNPGKLVPDAYLDTVEKAEKKKLIEVQIGRVRKQLERSLLDEPHFIIFPELTIPWEMQDELCDFAVEKGVYLIGGLTYGPAFENVCRVFPPFKRENALVQYKLNKAPKESKNVKTGQELLIFTNTGFGCFASAVCYDFTSLKISTEIRKHNVNILFLPTLNTSVALFDDMATAQCYTIYTYICLCNAAGPSLGGSGSYGPVRSVEGALLQQERVLGKIAGSQESTLTTILDMPGLFESTARFKSNRAVLSGFITPPADIRQPGVLVSPYTPLGPAKENFVLREEQKQEFWGYVNSNKHVLLLGPSGTGKTSLIHHLRTGAPADCRLGFIEVYDRDDTFDFFRRLAHEISSRGETEAKDIQFKETVQRVLDDVVKTQQAVDQHGYDKAAKVFLEAFHDLAQAVASQTTGTLLIFVDQAERLAWIEEDFEKKRYAIRILIDIMRDLEALGSPVLFALAIRQHDYDPLIALANDHIPAKIVGLQKFSDEDAKFAVKKPLPPEITIAEDVLQEIAELSGGIPFFVQLLADAAFNKLGHRKIINSNLFAELNIKSQRDVFPLLMKALTITEQKFVEAMGTCREYTVKMEDIMGQMAVTAQDFRRTADRLLGKNIVESLENERFRFVHDQMKGFIQREWLASKMSDREKLHSETETALQLLFHAPDDNITVSFATPPIAMCCSKSMYLDDIDNVSRILEQLATVAHRDTKNLCVAALQALFEYAPSTVFENLRFKLLSISEKLESYDMALALLAIEKDSGTVPVPKIARRALKLAESLAKTHANSKDEEGKPESIAYYRLAAEWAHILGDSTRTKTLFGVLFETVTKLVETTVPHEEIPWPYEASYNGVTVSEELPSACLLQTAEWAGKLNLVRYEKILLEKCVQLFLEEEKAWAEGRCSDSPDYEEAYKAAARIGNDEIRRELIRKNIDEYLESAKDRELTGSLGAATHSYAEAATLARLIPDSSYSRQLYDKAIKLNIKDAEQAEAVEDWGSATRSYVEAAYWATEIQDDTHKMIFYRKAVQIKEREAKEDESDKSYNSAAQEYAEAAEWSSQIEDTETAKKLYRKAIKLASLDAQRDEKKGDILSAARNYIEAHRWAGAIADNRAVSRLCKKAATCLKEVSSNYEQLTSFLLSRYVLYVAKALRSYFSKDETTSAWFAKIAAIAKQARRSIEASRRKRW